MKNPVCLVTVTDKDGADRDVFAHPELFPVYFLCLGVGEGDTFTLFSSVFAVPFLCMTASAKTLVCAASIAALTLHCVPALPSCRCLGA
jgi:hypothetical protein